MQAIDAIMAEVANAPTDSDRLWSDLQSQVHSTSSLLDAVDSVLATDDLFDANFAARPAPDERDFTLDLGRRNLVVETTLDGERFELVCWCRGDQLQLDVTLDGAPLAQGVRLGASTEATTLPLAIGRGAVPVAVGSELAPPSAGQALFWLEAGAGSSAPVVPTAEELERLRALGYAH